MEEKNKTDLQERYPEQRQEELAQKSINWTIFLPEVKCFNAFSFFL